MRIEHAFVAAASNHVNFSPLHFQVLCSSVPKFQVLIQDTKNQYIYFSRPIAPYAVIAIHPQNPNFTLRVMRLNLSRLCTP